MTSTSQAETDPETGWSTIYFHRIVDSTHRAFAYKLKMELDAHKLSDTALPAELYANVASQSLNLVVGSVMLNERLVEAPLSNMRSFDERYYMNLQSEIPTIRLGNGSIVVNKLGLGEILQMQLDANGSLTVLRKVSFQA